MYIPDASASSEVVVRVDEGSGPLLGALGARAVTVCRVLTLRQVVLGKSCDFSDEILRTRAIDSGQFELGACRLDARNRILFREGVSIWPCPKVAKILAIGLGNKLAIGIDQRRVPGGHFSKVTVKYWPAAARRCATLGLPAYDRSRA